MKRYLLRINHSDTQGLSYSWCACIRILHKNSVLPFKQKKLCSFKLQFVWSKISLFIELQVLANFDTHLENQRTYHKCIHGISQMFSILLLTARGILSSLICVVHFSNNFSNNTKKVHETYWFSRNIACHEKRTYWIIRIFTFNDKNPLYLPIISRELFEGQSDTRVTQLVIKPFDISQTSRILSLR